jgi:hypothetical protein
MNSIPIDLVSAQAEAASFSKELEELEEEANILSQKIDKLSEKLHRMNSPPLRMKYDKILSAIINQIVTRNVDFKDMLMNEYLLNRVSSLLVEKTYTRTKTAGYAWDEDLTNNICKALTHVPSNQRSSNPDFMKCVAQTNPFHPLRAGSGTWFCIHILSTMVKNKEDHMRVCDIIERFQETFYCPVCKKHFGEYLAKNNPRKLIQVPRSESVFREVIGERKRVIVTKLFEWSVDFHNAVNQHRINYLQAKSPLVFSLMDAYEMYYEGGIVPCSDCIVK